MKEEYLKVGRGQSHCYCQYISASEIFEASTHSGVSKVVFVEFQMYILLDILPRFTALCREDRGVI
jgi:hypothetical protein